MAIIIQGINSPVGTDSSEIIGAALKKAGIKKAVKTGIHKISLDARKQNDIKTVSSVWAELESRAEEEKICSLKDFCTYVDITPFEPKITGSISPEGRIAVCGFGPAGMFAALVLAEMGYRPLVLERGADVDNRSRAVSDFWHGGEFSPETNVQFGEGGAGTFSDGKLTTRIKDPLCRYVSARFAEFGAPDEILTKAKPHIGTDRLRGVVKNIRRRIISLGGEVRFNSQVTDISLSNGRLRSVTVNGSEEIPVCAMILAIGHSARDTFEMLGGTSLVITPKPFSVGVRIEHLQENIDKGLYGELAGDPRLPKGEYNLSCRIGGRGVYTFCMCPGGEVVAAASEHGGVVTNGMSSYIRNGKNANCAVAVSVLPDDFGGTVAGAINFQRRIESAAFDIGGRGYAAPCQSVGNFLGRAGCRNTIGDVEPTYMMGNVTFTDVGRVFPEFVTESLKAGIADFGKKLHGFDSDDALITAPETRTSSPIRICREKNFTAQNYKNLYVGGEGAGYAGGITSAAVDGINMALSLMAKYKPPKY